MICQALIAIIMKRYWLLNTNSHQLISIGLATYIYFLKISVIDLDVLLVEYKFQLMKLFQDRLYPLLSP